MHILIDENVPVQMLAMLEKLLPAHRVRHVSTIGWSGKKDQVLLRDAGNKGFDVFLTRDNHQLDDPEELAVIKRSGMHHVRFSQSQGKMVGLGLAMGAVVAAMPLIVAELGTADGQRLIHIKGLNPAAKHRFDITDPVRSPPAYWP